MHPKKIEFQGQKYRLSGNYYRRSGWSGNGPSNLHRAVWQAANGPIPDGHEIHHIDGNTFNNEMENLECIAASEHQREHMLSRIADGKMRPPSAHALAKAAEWHKSEAGKEWHAKHGQTIKEGWAQKEWKECTCQACGRIFRSAFPTRAKFCHANCRAAALRQRRGSNVMARSPTDQPALKGKQIS